ncbi:hypothetical protein [Paenibacillus soyae]|uniref:Uncharacterized protein n=1 Tax=Paenibacillus soyae TaxID=2969249 RepID=A0A9X2MTE7_9BACL|nr:hypothetical protein [Paenibacillus soyae]MCR2803397.1 hypothetical protein [Paenibacillus soyae]
MSLTDQQYWQLARGDQVEEVESVLQLARVEKLVSEGLEAVSYLDADGGHVLVVTFTLEDVHLGLNMLYDTDSELHARLHAFVRKYAEQSPCRITGREIGGAFGLYHAAVIGGLTGVVFDAPGIGKLLTTKDLDSISIRNIASESSVLPAIGVHPYPAEFARPGTGEEEPYSFDQAGAIQPGEPNELYRQMARINSMDEAAHERFRTRIRELAAAAGIDPTKAEEEDVALTLHGLELSSIILAIPKLVERCDLVFQEQLRIWKSDVEPLLHHDARRQGDSVVERTTEAARQMAEYARAFHEDMEAILSVAALRSLDRKEGLEQLEAIAARLAAELGDRLTAATNKLTDQLEVFIMARFG